MLFSVLRNDRYDIPKEALIQISNQDSKKMLDLLKRPYIIGNKALTEQVFSISDTNYSYWSTQKY